MMIGIYKITNKINGHMYIGQSVNIERRFREHQIGKDADRQAIDRAILKYGKDNFIYKIIEEFDKDTPFLDDVLNDSEKYYISAYNTFKDRNHYNLTPGGDGVGSEKNHPRYGKKHSEEVKRKISKNHADYSGENHPFYGKHHSGETRRKISEAMSGKNHPMYGKTGKNTPRYKNYPRIIKKGFKNKKQNYAIKKDGKNIKESISKKKLKKWFKKEYPNEKLVDETI